MKSKLALGQIVSDHARHGNGSIPPAENEFWRTDQSNAHKVKTIMTNSIEWHMRQLPKLLLATAAFLVTAAAVIAAPPDLRTPAPVIHLADNLDEADDLGWCIDTIGRGLSDRLHAQRCLSVGANSRSALGACAPEPAARRQCNHPDGRAVSGAPARRRGSVAGPDGDAGAALRHLAPGTVAFAQEMRRCGALRLAPDADALASCRTSSGARRERN